MTDAGKFSHVASKLRACVNGILVTTDYVNIFLLANCNVIFTGVTGSGKSSAGNFFLNKEAFEAAWSLKPVTKARASVTGVVMGERITIIDTPGFLDPSSLNTVEEFKGLAKAIVDMPNGVNAVGLLINIKNRVTSPDAELLEMLLATKEMLPYAFLVFTHAIVLGKTEKQQQQKLEETLKDKNECPESLFSVLSKIDNRYILLESVNMKGEGYYEKKSQELLDILETIMNKNEKVYICALNVLGENLRKFSQLQDKDKVIEKVTADLQTIKESQNSKPGTFWRNLIVESVGISLGATVIEAGVLLSPTT